MGESIKDQMENFNEEGGDTLSIPIPFAVSPRSPVYKTRGINYARVVEDVGRRTPGNSWWGVSPGFPVKSFFRPGI